MTTEPVDAPTWAQDPDILSDAIRQAIPFTKSSLIPDTAERAWADRVQAAVNGMDVADPQGMDAWMQAHANDPESHVREAELVAAYETEVRNWTESMEAAWAAEETADLIDLADDDTHDL